MIINEGTHRGQYNIEILQNALKTEKDILVSVFFNHVSYYYLNKDFPRLKNKITNKISKIEYNPNEIEFFKNPMDTASIVTACLFGVENTKEFFFLYRTRRHPFPFDQFLTALEKHSTTLSEKVDSSFAYLYQIRILSLNASASSAFEFYIDDEEVKPYGHIFNIIQYYEPQAKGVRYQIFHSYDEKYSLEYCLDHLMKNRHSSLSHDFLLSCLHILRNACANKDPIQDLRKFYLLTFNIELKESIKEPCEYSIYWKKLPFKNFDIKSLSPVDCQVVHNYDRIFDFVIDFEIEDVSFPVPLERRPLADEMVESFFKEIENFAYQPLSLLKYYAEVSLECDHLKKMSDIKGLKIYTNRSSSFTNCGITACGLLNWILKTEKLLNSKLLSIFYLEGVLGEKRNKLLKHSIMSEIFVYDIEISSSDFHSGKSYQDTFKVSYGGHQVIIIQYLTIDPVGNKEIRYRLFGSYQIYQRLLDTMEFNAHKSHYKDQSFGHEEILDIIDDLQKLHGIDVWSNETNKVYKKLFNVSNRKLMGLNPEMLTITFRSWEHDVNETKEKHCFLDKIQPIILEFEEFVALKLKHQNWQDLAHEAVILEIES